MNVHSPISINIPDTNKPRVVIVGGGFAGIQLAKGLKGEDVQVVLVDRNNYHTFQPLLYQVATAGLEPDSIAYPLRKIFKKQQNLLFRMADVLSVEPEKKSIGTSIGSLHYDYLVIATGSKTNYVGMEDMRKNAIPMKSIPEALNLRSLTLQNFETALLSLALKERQGLMNFVIIGGGPTGVEMAGALGELKNHILPRDYPELDFKQMQIHIVDLAPRLLPSMSEHSSRKAEEFLKKFDVTIWLKTKVVTYDGFTLTFSDDKKIISKNVIWAAGVTGAVLPGFKSEGIVKSRLTVDAFNRVDGTKDIFAIGDVAAMIAQDLPQGHPMLAPVAMQQGRLLAKNLIRLLHQQELKAFHYRNFGVMATVGRNQAVVDLPFVHLQGVIGWLVWVFVHLMALVGFRNRVVTFVNWVLSYLSYDKGIRLIIRPFQK